MELVSHPVHILDHEDGLSPSAFIPFCSFVKFDFDCLSLLFSPD